MKEVGTTKVRGWEKGGGRNSFMFVRKGEKMGEVERDLDNGFEG